MQSDKWKPLTAAEDYFKDCQKKPIWYIFAADHPRTFYLSNCENIAFQNRAGKDIWTTKGEGEIVLPPDVGIYIVNGMSLPPE
jgi:hypothetical protein